MSFDLAVDAIVHRSYCPTRGLPELASSMTGEFVREVAATDAYLWLQGCGGLRFDREGAATPGDPPPRSAWEHTEPLIHGGRVLGELHLAWSGPPPPSAACCPAFAHALAIQADRHAVQRWTHERFGQAFLRVGVSAEVGELERAIERAGVSRLPVIVRGEFGTEAVPIAVSLHCGGSVWTAPFVEIHCPSLDAAAAAVLAAAFERAGTGTLFLSGIDALPIAAQVQLMQLLPSRLGQSVQGRDGPQPRIISSTCDDLAGLARDGRFLRPLLTELDVLSVELPPVRRRTGDVPHLARYFLQKHGFSPARKWTGELSAICEAYAWPENLLEVERTMLRLAVMTDGEPIRRRDVARHMPWLLGAAGETEAGLGLSAPDPAESFAPAAAPPRSPRPPVSAWIAAIAANDFDALPDLHDCLRRALVYIANNYQDPISLTQLARNAHVSPSHLSFLFRQAIGVNFKLLLAQLRIEKAKLLLAQNGRQRITEVAANAGFSDLSHFEKTFRRFVAVCPREYRSRFAAAPAP